MLFISYEVTCEKIFKNKSLFIVFKKKYVLLTKKLLFRQDHVQHY